MNKKFAMSAALVVGAAVLGASLGGMAWAQGQPARPAGAAPAAAPTPSVLGRTRVALVNLAMVMKNYNKYKALRDQVQEKEKPFMDQLQAKNARIEKAAVELKDAKITPQRRDAVEAEIRQLRFDMDSIRAEAQKVIVKYQEDQLATLYREVYQVTSEYAAANGIDLVLRYNEDWGDDYNSPAKVVGRMNMPLWVMYYDKSMEITGTVAQLVNSKFGAAAAAAPAGGGVVPVNGPGK